MHIQIITFNLEGVSEEDYCRLCKTIAPAFADLPGLASKIWLANPETSTYGGLYVWRYREAREAYEKTDIFKGLRANPHFENVSVKDFAVLEAPTHITGGLSEVVL